MPSGIAPPGSAAHSRRPLSEPSVSIVNAVRQPPNDSPTINVEPSGVITIPLGNRISSAATRCAPLATSTASITVGRGDSPAWRSNPNDPMYAVPVALTTMSLIGWSV